MTTSTETTPHDTAEEKTTSAPETTAAGTAETKKTTKTAGKARKKAKTTKAKPATAKPVMYSSAPPKGLWPVGTQVKYLGGSKLRNDWLKKGAEGRVFGYRPGKTGGGLYKIRFEKGSTLLSVKRVEKVTTKG